MTDIEVYGTIEQLHRKINDINQVLRQRTVLGYSLLQRDERWQYYTQEDKTRVCYLCEPYDNQILTGTQLQELFGHLEFLGDGQIHPHNHHGTEIPYPCYCRVTLLNSAEVVEGRLHQEKLEVV